MGLRLYLFRACCALLLAWPAHAWALTVHTGVLGDPRGGPAGAEAEHIVASLLGGSGIYDVVDGDVLRGRIGEPPEALFSRCGSDTACWRGAAAAGGIELLVLVERVDARTLGIRVLDVTTSGDFRMGAAPLGMGGGPDRDLLDHLFFRPGGLRLVGAPEGAEVLLDGRPVSGSSGWDRLAAGKHTLEIEAEGRVGRFVTVVVVPDTIRDVPAALPLASAAPPLRLTRWTTWVGVGLVVGGATTVFLATEAPGIAVFTR